MHAIALPTNVTDLVEEYDEKAAKVEQTIAAVKLAFAQLGLNSTIRGTYAEQVASEPHLHASSILKNLLKSGWKAAYSHLEIDRLATAQDKQLFERTIADPPPFTIENCKATFGDYLVRPRFHILRGLAEVFCDLDPAYKSHSNVKIGKDRLPKRVILSGWGEYSSYGADKFRDIANALAAVRGQEPMGYVSGYDYKVGEDTVLADRGLTLRRFKNGNAHLIFDKWALHDINKALGEFYGDVLPDVEDGDAPHLFSTALSKDLQFYWTPEKVADEALSFARIHSRDEVGYSGRDSWTAPRVLEPSCGDGRIMDALAAKGCRSLGIEVHPGRAAEAKAKGHAVVTGNFLEQRPEPVFDFVVMNPPFYGKHYAKHVRHALKFLKPGGTLVSILPATARYDHNELDDLIPETRWASDSPWKDLPVASFADAGTNVPTVLLRLHRPA